MIDFHSHILPNMDDGADSIETSLELLSLSRKQGITEIVATPHFYATDESPEDFLRRREASFERLKKAMNEYSSMEFPKVYLGAEVLFYPEMSGTQSLRKLTIADTCTILIEPPMEPWTESMITEMKNVQSNLRLLPVIAHVDRYMRILKDDSLINRVISEKMLVQVNASFFIHEDSRENALECLKNNRIHLIGSDCHSLKRRTQNIGKAAEIIRDNGCARYLASLTEKSMELLH